MEDQNQNHPQMFHIRGKDLPGAVNVLPAGLTEVLAKRESREISFEQNSNIKSGFKSGQSDEFSSSSVSVTASHSAQVASHDQQPSMVVHSQSVQKHYGEEIHQECLKSTLQSAITDIEQQLNGSDFDKNKENLEPQHNNVILHTVQEPFRRFKFPHEFKGRPQSLPADQDFHYQPNEPLDLPDVGSVIKSQQKVEMKSKKEEHLIKQQQQEESTTMVNGVSHHQHHHHQESSFSTSTSTSTSKQFSSRISTGTAALDKVLNPNTDFDCSSLKRRNPKQMFTDSAFYSPKFHPSVADQVEMAHKLSSSLYDDGNKLSKGQEMYLKRAKKSGGVSDSEDPAILPHHDEVPNLKLVMNPEGKLHDWTDLPDDELPELQMIALGGPSSDLAQHVVENLQASQGRGGELFAKRRKKAEKWVVDEHSIGTSIPSQYADQFVQQQMLQQQQFHYQQQQDVHAEMKRHEQTEEDLQQQRKQLQEQQQLLFKQQQLEKQQQSIQIRHKSTIIQPQAVDLPPDFKPCSLKSRSFTPTFDDSCHNVQGIDVWANKAPRPYGRASTLPRTASHEISVADSSRAPAGPPKAKMLNAADVERTALQASSSSHVADNRQEELEDQKRREYEAWFRAQEKEQQLLEYECSVKYEEKLMMALNQMSSWNESSNVKSVLRDELNHEANMLATPGSFSHNIPRGHEESFYLDHMSKSEETTDHSFNIKYQEQCNDYHQQMLVKEHKYQSVHEEMRREEESLEQMQMKQRTQEDKTPHIEDKQRNWKMEEHQRKFIEEQEQKTHIEEENRQRKILEEQERQQKAWEEQERQQKILEEQARQQKILEEQARQQKMQEEQERQRKMLEEQERQRKMLEEQERQRKMLEEQERQRMILEEQARQQKMQEEQERQRKILEEQERQRMILEEQARQQKIQEEQARQREILEEQERQRKIWEEQARQQMILEEQERQQKILEEQARQREILEEQDRQLKMMEEQERQQKVWEEQSRQRKILEEQERQRMILDEQERQQRLHAENDLLQKQRLQLDCNQHFDEAQTRMQQQKFLEEHWQMSCSNNTHAIHELQNVDLSMQIKSGGLLGHCQFDDGKVEDYVGSLRPTTTGSMIRSTGDVCYSQAGEHDMSEFQGLERRQKQSDEEASSLKKDYRQSGVFVGIAGEHNALVNSSEAFDYEKHSVKDLVQHFSKNKPSDISKHLLPQNYSLTSGGGPQLSFQREQASERQVEKAKKEDVAVSEVGQLKMDTTKRRNSLKDYLLMNDATDGHSTTQIGHQTQLVDPSAILKVDGSLESIQRTRLEESSNTEVDGLTSYECFGKWDNHNTIARGWTMVKDPYHPVIFRRIYGVAANDHN